MGAGKYLAYKTFQSLQKYKNVFFHHNMTL